MLFLLVISLALLKGPCWGLQVGMEYDYQYYGEVWVGIPEIRKHVGGVGLRGDISFQVVDADHVLAMFTKFEVGDMNGDLSCDRDARLPIDNWAPLPNMDHSERILDPFKFNMMDVPRGEFVMEVAHDEPHWMTDIKKSVAQIFRIYPLKRNIHHKKSGLSTGDFSIKEETLFGKCQSSYQVTPMIESFKQKWDFEHLGDMEEDTQLGRRGFMDNLWSVSRHIDFAECEEFVKVRDLSMQNECGERPYQCNRGDLGRSHTGDYILRGDEPDLRLEMADIVDWAVMEPYAMGEKGYQTEQIRAMSKQNLKLYAVRPLRGAQFDHETGLNITSWRYDLQPPPHHTSRQPSFDEMMVGLDVDPKFILTLKEDMMKGICDISVKLNGVVADDFVNDYDVIVFNMNYLEIDDIDIINNKLRADSSWEGMHCWKTWIKFLTVSGAKPTQEFLMRELKANRLSRDLIVNYFANIAANAQSTYIMKDLIQYVSDHQGDGDDDMTMLGVYQLTYMSNWCVQPVVKAGLTDPTCGHQHCDPALVNEVFFPFLDKGIRNQTLPHWQRVIYMVMLCGIRSTFKNDVLRPFITGETPSSNAVRLNAIASLSLYKMPPETREECMDMLSAVLNDFSESSSVRACSYMIELTWRPTPAWWHLKAIDTWKEPNRQIASLSFKSTIIKYTTDRRLKWLDLILPIMKPAPSSGASMSSIQHYYYKILTTGWESTWMNSFLVSRNDEVYPERYVQFYQPMRVGQWFPQTQVFRYLTVDLHKTQDVWYGMRKYFWGTYPSKENKMDPVATVVRGLYNQHKDYINVRPEEVWDYGTWYVYTKWQRSFEHNQPVTARPEDFFNFNYLIKTLPKNYDFQEGLFFNYGKINIGFPSSIGIPIVFRSSSPNYQTATGNWKLHSAENYPSGIKAKAEFDATFRSMHQTHITASALTPWNNRRVIAGFEMTYSMVFPFKYELEADTTFSNDLTIRMTPRPQAPDQKVSIIEAFNIPFIVRAPLYPYNNYMHNTDWKLLEVMKPEKKIVKLEMPKITGLSMTSMTVDHPGPYYDLFPYPHTSKTLTFWSWQIWYDPSKSSAKSITVSLSYERPNESQESKSWGQPINPVTRMVDWGRNRLFYKRPDLFTVDPNKQRHTGRFSFDETTDDMVRPTIQDLWEYSSSNREPSRIINKPKAKLKSYVVPSMFSGDFKANNPKAEKLLMFDSKSFWPQDDSNTKNPVFMSDNAVSREWTHKRNSYKNFRSIETLDDMDVIAQNSLGLSNTWHPSEPDQELNGMIWMSEDPYTYYEDVELFKYNPQTSTPVSQQGSRRFSNKTNKQKYQARTPVNRQGTRRFSNPTSKRQYVADEQSNDHDDSLQLLDYDDVGHTQSSERTNKSPYKADEQSDERSYSDKLMDYDYSDYLDDMAIPTHSRKKRQSSVPFHTFPFTETADITTFNVGIDIEDTLNKRVDIDLYWAQGGAEGRFGSHIQSEIKFSIGSGVPYMMCMNLEGTWPYMFPIHLIKDFVQTSKDESHHKFVLWLWSGEKCIIDEPSLEMVGQFSLSEKGRDYIENCIVKFVGQQNCPYRMDDPAYYLLHRFYDDAIIKATWFDRVPSALVNLTHFYADFLKGLTGPLIWHNHMVRNEPNKAVLTAKRRVIPELLEWYYHLDRNSWDVEVKLPNSESYLEDLRIHKWLEDLMMPYPFLDYNNAEWIRGAEAAICRIEHNKISTTDHVTLWTGPTECWAIASKDCMTSEEWMVLVRNDEGRLVARILWPEWAVMIDVSRDAVWVNGEVVEVRDQIIGHGWKIIRQKGDMYVFFKDGQHQLRVGEFIWFMPGYLVTQRVCGLCGNMNDLYYDETVGPRGCAYGDHQLLVLAWSVASCDACSTWELMKAKAPVYTYQRNKCKEFKHVYTAERYGKQSKAVSSCTTWFYEKRKIGEYSCIAEKPSPTCKPGCVSPSKRPENSTQCASGDTPLEELASGPLVGPWQFKSSGLRAANPECSEVPLEYKCVRETDLEPDTDHFGECQTSLYYTIIPTYVPSMCFPANAPVFPYPGM